MRGPQAPILQTIVDLAVGMAILSYLYRWIMTLFGLRKAIDFWTYLIFSSTLYVLLFALLGLHIYALSLSRNFDLADQDHFVPMSHISSVTRLETYCMSLVMFVAWFKLMSFMAVFRTIARMSVIMEMMVRQLLTFMILLILAIVSFSTAEYVAYGFRETLGYTYGMSFLVRTYEMFSGMDYEKHIENNRPLGTFYSIGFVLTLNLLLMNLIVALLTTAYDAAVEQSGSVYWANQQFMMIKHELRLVGQYRDRKALIAFLKCSRCKLTKKNIARWNIALQKNIFRYAPDQVNLQHLNIFTTQQNQDEDDISGDELLDLPVTDDIQSPRHVSLALQSISRVAANTLRIQKDIRNMNSFRQPNKVYEKLPDEQPLRTKKTSSILESFGLSSSSSGRKASERLSPSASNSGPHRFYAHFYKTPTWCGICGEFLVGVFEKQGMQCSACKLDVHVKCASTAQTDRSCAILFDLEQTEKMAGDMRDSPVAKPAARKSHFQGTPFGPGLAKN